ncbi:unnamed protein product [Moneuplotes crassus]|uniref:Tetratricopeptide repeat protein 5 OB fold domain-containing protein n=1 Tax=Euplotes crassus TaxID=5936 RepID=A0AAD1X6D0_EUPCR|nr:unnamed protein product [Moneuplotes crassus]
METTGETTEDKTLTVRQGLNDLEILDDTYFQKDRDTKIQEKFDSVMEQIEKEYSGYGDDAAKESEYIYLKSKAQDFMPTLQKEAKEGMEKALELNGENYEAIRDLGVVYYKEKDYLRSMEFYNKALEIKGDDRKCLGYLSIALRAAPTKDDAQKQENLEKGITLAKEAINQDIMDGYSWYLLGNSYMSAFFTLEKYEYLDNSLKAYTQSEKTQKYPNPDLYFNRASICTYFERYSEAIRDYMTAHSIDPGLNGQSKAEKIVEFVIGTTRMIEQKKKSKNKKTSDLVKELPKALGEVKFLSTRETEETFKYKLLPQPDFEAGENRGVIFSAKVICQIHKDPPVPACFLVIDSSHTYSVVSLYSIHKGIKDKIKYGDEILIRDPVLMFISIEYQSRLLTYPSIRVIHISDILVNQETLSDVYGKAEAISESQ